MNEDHRRIKLEAYSRSTSVLDLQKNGQLQSPAMRFDWPVINRIVQRYFAILVLLWWGGLNCLSGCLAAPPDGAGESYCAMGKGSHCCHTHKSDKASRPSKTIEEPSGPSCCSLLSLAAEESCDAHSHSGATTTAIFNPIEFTPESKPHVQFPDRWARLPDRGGTHLFHCVFLI